MTPKSMPPTLLEKINTDLSGNFYNPPSDNDQTFIVGTASDDNYKPNNYLWYSGKMWRIVALNKTVGVVTSIKIVTNNLMTMAAWNGTLEAGGSGGTVYENSFAYQWLNEDFYETLRYPTSYLITNYSWNATESNNNNKPPNTTMVAAPVGMLNRYEYYNSYTNTTAANGYLNVGYRCSLITPASINSLNFQTENGNINTSSNVELFSGFRPSINLKFNIRVTNGNGTIDNPYRLVGDNDTEDDLINDNLNTRYSGEYVRFNNEDYRIMKVENDLTKLTKVDYIRYGEALVTKTFGTTKLYSQSLLDGTNHWGRYLNNETANGWYGNLSATSKNMIETGTWYLGNYGEGYSYKRTICASVKTLAEGGTLTSTCEKTAVTASAKVGLLRIGEMFAAQIAGGSTSSSYIYTLTPLFSSDLVYTFSQANYGFSRLESMTTRPSFYLKSSVKIASGDGTPNNPFTVAM